MIEVDAVLAVAVLIAVAVAGISIGTLAALLWATHLVRKPRAGGDAL